PKEDLENCINLGGLMELLFTGIPKEIANHKLFSVNFGEFIAPCQGISQDPKTKEYIMVVPYMEGGRLNSIHKRGLIHKDFHPGNLLIGIQEHQDAPEAEIYSISDLGLYNAPEQRPTANELERILHEWVYDVKNQRETEFYQQYKEAQTLRYYKLLSVIYKKHIGRETKIENEVEAEQIGYELLLNFERSYLSTFDHNSYSIRMIKERTRLINTKQITQQLEKLKNDEEYHTKSLEELTLSLDSLNLDELTIQEDLQEQSSTQAQIQIPPKK
ncbi:938_t:CDS:2, partial [Paraglomus occultum]